jgi:ketosteroid isomerase-like protein
MVPTPARPRIEIARCRAYTEAWIAAWNAHDLDRIMSHYAATLCFTSPVVLKRYPGSDGTIRDAKALREYFAIGLRSLPDLRFELVSVLRAVDGFSMYYINAVGGHTAEYVELDAQDHAVRVIACYSD